MARSDHCKLSSEQQKFAIRCYQKGYGCLKIGMALGFSGHDISAAIPNGVKRPPAMQRRLGERLANVPIIVPDGMSRYEQGRADDENRANHAALRAASEAMLVLLRREAGLS